MENIKEVYNFYEIQYNENNRFSPNPLEFIRSKDIIKRYLEKPHLAIADIAGAAGPYSYWLAEQGHEVHLLDLSDKHIALAKDYGLRCGIELSSLTCGDARQLPYEDNKFDMVLNMGALYHLQNDSDRMKCITECYRVLKPGGRAIIAYTSRFASLVDGYKYRFVDDPEFQKILATDLKTGKHNNPQNIPSYFTTAFYHTPDLVVNELQRGNFQNIKLLAVEGFASIIDTDNFMKDDNKKELLLKHIKLTEEVPELLGISTHIIATCTKKLS
ncbi:class I SAM-dependent methyltransferase [Klebsiella quasipneumoniae]